MNCEGSCLCGKQHFVLTEPPISQGICYCRDCQKAGGAEGSPLLVVRTQALQCKKESLSCFEMKSEQGTHVRRYFCPHCGSPIFSQIVEVPEVLTVKVAGLNEPGDFKPQYVVWTRSALPSTVFPEGAARFPRGAPLALLLGITAE
jgi:hypothetical protein